MISVAVCIQSFSPARRSLPESTISTALASHWQWHCVPSASVLLLKSSIGSRLNRFLSCRRCCMPAYFNIFRSLEPLISDAGGRCSAGHPGENALAYRCSCLTDSHLRMSRRNWQNAWAIPSAPVLDISLIEHSMRPWISAFCSSFSFSFGLSFFGSCWGKKTLQDSSTNN